MREPKKIADYCSLELAAKGLEDFARDLRGSREGTLVRWDLNIRFWHPSWKKKNGAPSVAAVVAGFAAAPDDAVTDASGRLIAPPQPTTPARPSGPHDGNADAREPVRE